MTRTMRLLLSAVVAAALSGGAGHAATYTAASCNESDVQTAINNELATPADGDIISIPAGTCTWTGITGLSASFTTSVTIQGAGAISATTGGASTTGTDQTVILDNLNHSSLGYEMNFTPASGKSFRLTGIYFHQNGSTGAPSQATVFITGSTTAVRVDHCHFDSIAGAYELFFSGNTYGVADHNYIQGVAGNPVGGIRFEASNQGYNSWNQADQWGTANFAFIEDSLFSDAGLGDCHLGGRYVFRHNTVTSSTTSATYMADHALDPGGAACRAGEWYDNTMTVPASPGANLSPTPINGGSKLFWGNTVTGYREGVQIGYTRQDNSTYNYGSPPSGYGNCNTTSGNGWDQNTSGMGGYACMDQPGRGRGDLLSGYPPTLCNQTQGCPNYTGTWPRQALSPIYVWNNTFTPATGYSGGTPLVATSTGLVSDNRDYYQQFGTNAESGSNCAGSPCNITAGINQTNRAPVNGTDTCTAGNSALTTLYNSGAPGVGWWDTSNSTLYVCTATNTWTAYYTPYTYPHPLTQNVPNPPTNLTATAH